MEFWGVEVKAGKPFQVTLQKGKVIHISQAALGETKGKENESVLLHVKIDGQKLVLGTLIKEKIPQVNFDLVLHKEFELSHDWKHGDVYFCGYTGESPSAEDSDSDDDSDEEELAPVPVTQNEVKPTADKGKATKPESSAKPKVTFIEPKKKSVESSDDDDDEVDDSDDDDEVDGSDEDMPGALDGNDDDSEDEDDSNNEDDSDDEEETPNKPVNDKKRANESAMKTPVQAKKAKGDTPQKTDGKKGVHVATPYPSKQAGKPTTANNSAMAQTPKSEGKVTCKSCSRTFNSENALQSHTKAKHIGI
ncbi:histone deacetylase HDT1-like [Impatiens glandulifera]|uniref:histone deacetylase HDT1-like n=1 Tax=Impatiens glandulifera TaxID=253017 RepID=UPI001FB14FE9|nr:histone deacetylase HDT1-like [Impatiens glandulifera]